MNAEWWDALSAGAVVTLKMLPLCAAFSIAGAFFLALGALSQMRLVSLVSKTYIEVMRGIPLLALLIVLYFGLGSVWVSLGISAFWVAVILISLNEAAYLAEVYRSSIQSVRLSQWDAAASLGMTRGGTLKLVVLPQALISAMPPTVNAVMYLLKGTSLASLISVNELTLAGDGLSALTYQSFTVYLIVGLMYLTMSVPLAYGGRLLERTIWRRLGLSASQRIAF